MKRFITIVLFVLICMIPAGLYAAEAEDETALFTSVAPDALLLLDLSGSMAWNPAGGDDKWGNSSCTGTFYSTSGSGHTTDCSRLAIAKRAIFNILDDNNNNTIDSQDESSLGIRIGFMRFKDGDDTAANYSSGNIKLVKAISTKYSSIYCSSNTSCASTVTSCSGSGECVVGETANGGTPLASSLHEAKLYLDAHKAADNQAGSCRPKFLLVITDGSDTYACGGAGTECTDTSYKRRREAVAKAKALQEAGYKIFVIGFGANMPGYLQDTLNWMAYYGGTDNPDLENTGNTSAYNIASGAANLYPAGVTACMDSTLVTGICTDSAGNHSMNFFANANDPGTMSLSGYAFLAGNADELSQALRSAMNIIREAVYSFSQASIQSSRTVDENFVYEGSFQPVNQDPFWLGHLKKYQINDDGTIAYPDLWDAGDVLQAASSSARTIKTYKSGSLVDFTTANITAANLGVANDTERNKVVGFFRGDPAYSEENWKLGDIFRATPITVGTPSAFFDDVRDSSTNTVTNCVNGSSLTVNAFAAHRATHCRTSAAGTRAIVSGANDAMFHIFRTDNGSEAWAFVPPNLLPKLRNIAHSTHPTAYSHAYFVDGPVTVADLWLGSGDGATKSPADWHTILVFGEGRGSSPYTWSSSQYCDSGMSDLYSTTYQYYCGYWAFNLDNALVPTFKWHLAPTAAQAPFLGYPWNKFMTGRILTKTGGVATEKWVGFIGAGYNAADCRGGGACDTRGKGFFVVDMNNGNILWSYTHADDGNMDFSMAAPAAIVDTDNDGFIDTVYGPDLGGNVWRFKLCTAGMLNGGGCTTADWTAGRLFESASGNIRPIFTIPAVAKDTSGNLWVYFGTGDKADPTAANAQERFFAIKDNDRTTTYGTNALENITSTTQVYTDDSTKHGWFLNLAGQGQKILADPTVFGGIVYFTSFTPANGNNACDQGGTATLWGLKMFSGEGALNSGASGGETTTTVTTTETETITTTVTTSETGTITTTVTIRNTATGAIISTTTTQQNLTTGLRSADIGVGIATAPLVSLRPDPTGAADLYVTVSGGGGAQASTQRINFNPPGVSNRTNILFWHDRRVQ